MPTRLQDGINRVKDNWTYVLQVGLAAGLSYWVGLLIGHEHPFFAPMSVVIVLSTAGGERFRKSLELVVGVSVGVGLGDLIVASIGSGPWQIAFGVMCAVTAGMLLDRGVLVANQAAFASILVATILPPSTSGGFERMTDAFIGGIVGLIVLGFFPILPLRAGQREVAKMLRITSTILAEVARELPDHDTAGIAESLHKARGTQTGINKMIAAAQESKEAISVSPLMWRSRTRLGALLRILDPVDNAIRNTRVLARRALALVEDNGEVSAAQLAVIAKLSAITCALADALQHPHPAPGELDDLAEQLHVLAHQAHPNIAAGRPLSAHAILAQSRSIIVDLLEICGHSRDEALDVMRSAS
ncbi:MAG: FUSC family protein [Corynebacterium sp.]|nr:FUSC family protein [Corynebacterium sp.]